MFGKLVIIASILLLGVVFGAPSVPVPAEKTCEMIDGFMADTCFLRFDKFFARILDDRWYRSHPYAMREDCRSFQSTCFPIMHCDTKKEYGNLEFVESVKTFCKSLIYLGTEFAPCEKKMETTRSQCPPWRYAEKPCEPFQGENNCWEREITQLCSKKEWIGLRDSMLDILGIIGACEEGKTFLPVAKE